MRILTISNLYPPHFIGGYELGCRDVMQGLVQRGHQVRVLTSTWQIKRPVVEEDGSIKVHRGLRHYISLPQEPQGMKLWLMNARNRALLRRVVREFGPDLIYIWNLAGFPPQLAFDAGQTGLPLCCYISDLWLSRWKNQPEATTNTAQLRFRCVQCTSDFIRQATMTPDMQNAPDTEAIYQVIHWGVNTGKFDALPNNLPQNDGPHRLIYAGQLAPHKGVSTAIEAVQNLKQSGYQVHLTIAGPSTYGNHGEELRELAQRLKLQNEIEFLGPVAREKLPQLLAAHEIFIFPAVWDEPFSIGLLEAMAAGLAVVSTTTGGSREIVRHEENALAFDAGDASNCATQIKRLLDDDMLCQKLRCQARQTVGDNFTMQQMLNRIEASLQAAVKMVCV